jgi:hypothetical protein
MVAISKLNFKKIFAISTLLIGITLPVLGFAYNTGSDSTSQSTAVYTGGMETTGTVATGSTTTGTINTGSNSGTLVVANTGDTVIVVGGNTQTGTSIFDSTGLTFNDISTLGIPEDPEFLEALAWMYTNKLTSLGTPSVYRPFDKITREESTKIFGRFAKSILKTEFKTGISNESCLFADSGAISSVLSLDVFDACKLGLFKGGSGAFFNPQGGLTKAQSLAVLIRLFDNKSLSETTTPRFYNYYTRAYELEITKDVDFESFDRDVTRYEVALMVYRFNIKYKLLKPQADKLAPSNQFIGTIPNSVVTDTGNNLKSAMILINTSLLTDPNMQTLPVDILWTDFVLKKRKIDTYGVGTLNYVWFGDVYDLNQQYVGSASFTVLNGYVDEAYIRPTLIGNKYYQIQVGGQQPYYSLSEVILE